MFGPWNGMLGMPGYGGLLSPEDQAYLRNQGMMSLAGNLLAASGPSPVKQNFGSIAGKGMLGMQQGQQQAMQGLLQNKLYGAKLGEIEREKQREQELKGLLGSQGQPSVQREIPYRDVPGTPGTGLLGGQLTPEQFYAGVAGLGGDYTKQGLTGLSKLQPNGGDAPAAVKEWEYLKRQFPNMKLDFPTYLSVKRSGYTVGDIGGVPSMRPSIPGLPVIPLSTLQNEVSGQSAIAGGTKAAATLGASQADAQFNLGSNLDEISKMRTDVNNLMSAPGFKTIYGASGTFDPRNYLPGTDAAGAEARRNQLEAASFGISIQRMRGLGQLSDAEGKKMTAAYTRAIDRRQPDEEAKKAWDEVLGYLNLAEVRAKEKAGNKVTPNQPGASTTQVPNKRIRVDAQGNVVGN